MADSDGATAPAVATSDTPPAPASASWRLGGVAVAGGLVVSSIIHLSLVGTVLLVSPLLLHPEPATPVTVDLVTPEELAALSDKSDKPNKPAEPEKPQQSAAAAPDRPAEAAQQPAPPAPPPLPTDAFPMPFVQSPAPRVPPAPAPPAGPAAQLAELLGIPVPEQTNGGPSEYKADLTPEEIAAFAAHVQSCWDGPASLAQVPKLYVVIRVNLRRDGGLATDPVAMAGSASAQGPALAQGAKRALQRCQPYDVLPAAKYDEWRVLDLQFTGSGISTATPVSRARRTPQRPG
jgi:hypothetical protein